MSQENAKSLFESGRYKVTLAQTESDLTAAQRLRYTVFVEELGASGPDVDHVARLERDRFDPYMDHMVLIDKTRDPAQKQHVIGVYRLMRREQAARAGAFYSAHEFDLSRLLNSFERVLELGRSCVDPAFRGGDALLALWSGLARYIARYDVDILFGAASFHGTNIADLAAPLSLLHDKYLAPEALRPRAIAFQPMDLIPPSEISRLHAMRQVPALIKGYLRMGGWVGDGAYIDHDFNTTDICLIMETRFLASQMRHTQRLMR